MRRFFGSLTALCGFYLVAVNMSKLADITYSSDVSTSILLCGFGILLLPVASLALFR